MCNLALNPTFIDILLLYYIYNVFDIKIYYSGCFWVSQNLNVIIKCHRLPQKSALSSSPMIHVWIFSFFPSRTPPPPPFSALVLAIPTPLQTFTMIAPSRVCLSSLYPHHRSPGEELFIIAAHLWFISQGMDANSSLGACFKESWISVAKPNLCLQTTLNVCREAPFVFRAKQSSQWGASSSHLNSDSVFCFFFFSLLFLSLLHPLSFHFPFSHITKDEQKY